MIFKWTKFKKLSFENVTKKRLMTVFRINKVGGPGSKLSYMYFLLLKFLREHESIEEYYR